MRKGRGPGRGGEGGRAEVMSGKKSNATGKYCSRLTRPDVITAATDQRGQTNCSVCTGLSLSFSLSLSFPLISIPHLSPIPSLPFPCPPCPFLFVPPHSCIVPLPLSLPSLSCISLSLPFLSVSAEGGESGSQKGCHVFRHSGLALRRQLIFTTLQVIHSSWCIFV